MNSAFPPPPVAPDATTSPAPSAAEERSAEILASLRPVFAEKGFDGASMQDMARAAGMSVGNFYRYFPSKAAIVEAMVGMDLKQIEHDFAAIQTLGDPMEGLRAKIRERICDAACEEDGRLWAEITASALRKPEIGAASCRMEAEILHYLTGVFARATGLPHDQARARWSAHAALIVMIIKGSAMRHRNAAVSEQDLTRLVLTTIDRTLADIAADAAKG